ncbi:MAG: cofactor-independent phosphoglycerate mutase [Candidatus Jordarchaeales archaeon]|nr:cofactor-independent phosphoglycerate mutase [Candidatus Jordarchaeia archaeon]
MKCVVVVGDGMADYPLDELGGKTPLQVARKPNMDRVAREGRSGLLESIPEGMQAGSDVAILSILGYDPVRHYTGRGPIEAAALGVMLGRGDVAFRCNLVTLEGGVMVDYSAGHISNDEAKALIEALNEELGGGMVKFYSGVSYRNILVVSGVNFDGVECTPPHDITGMKVDDYLPRGEGSELLLELIERSWRVLEGHPVNARRIREGKRAANSIWPWGQGRRPDLQSFEERFGVRGAIISAVDLVRGLGVLTGLRVVNVPGATGYYDTNYAGKGEYALRALESVDFVLVHVEAPDEAGHAGDIENKVKAIEKIDSEILGKILDGIERLDEDYRVAVLADHPTPIVKRTHTRDPAPVAVLSSCGDGDGVDGFDEFSVRKGSLGVMKGYNFMNFLIGR